MTSRSYFSDREVVKGKVTFVNNATHMIRVDDEVVRTNDVPKKTLEKIIVGTFIEATFPKNSQYARSVVITEEVTMDKDFETAIREMEPFVSFIHTLSESEQTEIRVLYRNSVRDAISLYAVTATYDDTKKDTAEVVKNILETAWSMTICIDTNSKQILKTHLPELPESN